MNPIAEQEGLSVTRKEDFSKWYLEVVRKAGFKDQRTPIKGANVLMPWGYSIWEMIQEKFNELIKKDGVSNMYFPLFIPESLLKKEEQHLEGFKSEAAMVTEIGDTKLEERLAVRPTSETIMYYMFNKWIRSHKDLPFKINQWCNIVRWETKMTKPFVREREFLWQEGHTAHATKEDAVKQVVQACQNYKVMYDMMALDFLQLKRPKSDTFAGADYSIVFDTLVQDGKVIQGPDSHLLGQNFAKVFDVMYEDKNNKKQYVWQTSWGMTERQLGVMIMAHGDDKGAVLPPLISPIQVVIIPLIFKDHGVEVEHKAHELKTRLDRMGIRSHIDDRLEVRPGAKYNEWELKGVPLRIEIGPKDLENEKYVCVKRLDGEKKEIDFGGEKDIFDVLNELQLGMIEKSKRKHKEAITDVRTMSELKDKMKKGGIARTCWCGNAECDEWIKDKTGGGEIRGTLFSGDSEKALKNDESEEKVFSECVQCGKPAKHVVYVAKAY